MRDTQWHLGFYRWWFNLERGNHQTLLATLQLLVLVAILVVVILK